MIKITAVLPFRELERDYRTLFDLHNKTAYEQIYQEADFSTEVIIQNDQLENIRIETDVFIARGLSAYVLRKLYSDTPVIEIPIVGSDILTCLHRIAPDMKGLKVAVIGSANMTMGVERLSEIFDIDVRSVIVDSLDLLHGAVIDAYNEGYTTFLGGPSICEYAAQLNCNSSLILSGKDTIWHAITEAKKAACVSRVEQEKALRYGTILDYAHEGIIAVDNEKKITVFNYESKKILNTSRNTMIGEKIDTIIKDPEFNRLLLSDNKELDKLFKYRNIDLACNKVPIYLRGENVGNVITFRDITSILKTENLIRKKVLSKGHVAKYTFYDIKGTSELLKETISQATTYSRVDSSILLIGETGTGKEIFAQSIHNHSERKKGPFVAVNCAALPEELLESELFGYVEGAFTGAQKGGKLGLFELAHHGTLFLDKISEISYKIQGRLLRVIQEKEIMRLGSDSVTPIDVRIIYATNKNLMELVEQNIFREDLLYRIDVLSITLPPLRERAADIPVLIRYYIDSLGSKLGKEQITVSNSAMELLKGYTWPGNVRQLVNICERLVVLCNNSIINEQDIKRVLATRNSGLQTSKKNTLNTEDEITAIKRRQIIEALSKCNGNRNASAALLGMSRSTLWRKIQEFNITRDEFILF